jgi:NTE family protein
MPVVRPPVAFVLGGGGRLGAAEVGMLAALEAAGIRPDLVVGTSIGAINGAVMAADPASGVARLRRLWQEVGARGLFDEGVVARLQRLRRTGVSLHSNEQLQDLLVETFGSATRIEDLPVRFGCVAACIETAGAMWFDHGPLVPALLASSAVPVLFEAVALDGLHYLDGGLVDSIPLGRAVELGARTVFVLQVGRIEQPLTPPKNLAEVALVSFEIARRHRFATVIEALPGEVSVHVLPTGSPPPAPVGVREHLRPSGQGTIERRVARAEAASRQYLDRLEPAARGEP